MGDVIGLQDRQLIENDELEMMEKNLQDEIRILHDEVKKRVITMLTGQESRADLYDEHGRERLLKKGTPLTEDVLAALPYEAIVRLKVNADDPKSSGTSSRRRRRRSVAETNCLRASSSW